MLAFVLFALALPSGYICEVARVLNHPSKCFVAQVDYLTGYSTNLSSVDGICQDKKNPNSVAVSTIGFSGSTAMFYVTTGSGQYVWGANCATAAYQSIAPVPTKNGVVGLAFDDNLQQLYVVGTDGVYFSNGTKIGSLSLDTEALVTYSSQNRALYIADKSSLFTINLAQWSVNSVPFSLSAMDVSYYATTDSLIVLADYVLYSVDYSSGASTKLFIIPDGDGFPSTYDLYEDTYFFADFQHLYSVNLLNNTIMSKVDFDGYFSVGSFHFVPE